MIHMRMLWITLTLIILRCYCLQMIRRRMILHYLSLGGMMSTSRANIDETFVIGRRSLEGTSPSVMIRMLTWPI